MKTVTLVPKSVHSFWACYMHTFEKKKSEKSRPVAPKQRKGKELTKAKST